MKVKYLIVVGLMLAILTIGAVSATDDSDGLAVSKDTEDVVNAPDGVDIISEEGDYDPDDTYEEDSYDPADPYSDYFHPISVPESVAYNSDENITFTVKDDINGIIQMSDGRTEDDSSGVDEYVYDYKNFAVTNGKGVIPLKGLDIGSHQLYFNFIGTGSTPQGTVDKINEHLEDMDASLTVLPVVIPKYLYVDDDLIVTFSTPEGVTGNVSAYYNEKEYDEYSDMYYDVKGQLINTAKISDGQINLGKFGMGTQYVWFVFENETGEMYGDALYESLEFKVIDENPDWQIELKDHDEILKAEDASLEIVNIPEELEGSFELYIDGNPFQSKRNGDEIQFNATQLPEGPHSFEIKFLGDGYFKPTSISGTFNLTNVVIEIPEKYDMAEDNDSIVITMPKDATGWITVKANGVEIYSCEIEEEEYMDVSRFIVDLSELKFGLNDIEVNVTGKYPGYKTGKINATYSLSIAQTYLTYGDEIILLSVPSDATGVVTVIIDSIEYRAVNDDGNFYLKVPGNITIGNHSVTLRYSGDERYSAMEFNDNLEVIAEVVLPFDYSDFNKNKDKIVLKLPKDATGYLSVKLGKYINGTLVIIDEQLIPLENGEASYSLANLTFGRYNVVVNYTGGNYPIKECDVDGNEFKINPYINYPSVMVEGGKEVISIDLPGEKGEFNYYAYCGDDDFSAQTMLVNGKAVLSLADLPAGTYKIDVCFERWFKVGNDEYLESYIQDITVIIQKPSIKAANANVVYSSNSLYKVQITGVDNNLIVGDIVTFKINGKVIGTGKIDKNGYASIKITQKPGNYKITAVYNKLSVTKKLAVKHVLKLQKVKVKRSAKKLVIKATLAKVNGKYLKSKKITLKFNGKKYVAKTNKKGVAKFTIKKKVLKKLKKGKKVTYQATYLKDTVKYTVKVNK